MTSITLSLSSSRVRVISNVISLHALVVPLRQCAESGACPKWLAFHCSLVWFLSWTVEIRCSLTDIQWSFPHKVRQNMMDAGLRNALFDNFHWPWFLGIKNRLRNSNGLELKEGNFRWVRMWIFRWRVSFGKWEKLLQCNKMELEVQHLTSRRTVIYWTFKGGLGVKWENG